MRVIKRKMGADLSEAQTMVSNYSDPHTKKKKVNMWIPIYIP